MKIIKIDLIESLLKKIIVSCSVLVLVACASGSAKVDSRLQTTDVPTFKKMFVNINVETRNFNKTVADSLKTTLVSSLATCGIVTSVYVKDPLDINQAQTLKKQYDEFKPDSSLSIVRTAGQVLIGDGGNSGKFDVMLRVHKTNPRTEIWTAKSDVNLLTGNMFTNDTKSGERIAQQFFEIMKKDGVICK
jgi:hypothetical protein